MGASPQQQWYEWCEEVVAASCGIVSSVCGSWASYSTLDLVVGWSIAEDWMGYHLVGDKVTDDLYG